MRLGIASVRADAASAIRHFSCLYDKAYKETPWASEGILYLGILTFNETQDPAKALQHYEYVVHKYPDSPAALRALYFCCLNTQRLGDQVKLVDYCKKFLRKYPDSEWNAEIKSILSDQIQ
jgi:outer membrane protein assembly factor BamD (BamD/ComL family)